MLKNRLKYFIHLIFFFIVLSFMCSKIIISAEDKPDVFIESKIIPLSWSPNNTYLALGGYEWGEIFIWDITSGSYKRNITLGNLITDLDWSPDSTKIVATAYEKAFVLNTTNGNFIYNFTGHTSRIRSVDWSPNGTFIASGSNDSIVKIWEPETGNVFRTINPSFEPEVPGLMVEWSPDSNYLLGGHSIWNVSSGEKIKEFNYGENETITSVDWSYDGTKVVISTIFNTKVWDVASETSIYTFIHYGFFDWDEMECSPNSNLFAIAQGISTASYNGTIEIRNLITGELIRNITLTEWEKCKSVSWSPDGRNIAVSTKLGAKIFSIFPVIDNDADKDGILDINDAFPYDPAAAIDTDGDGFPDRWNDGMGPENSTTGLTRIDAYPLDPAASLDTDSDGYPDEWNPGKGPENSTTGLTKLDDFPYNATQWNDTDSDGWGDNYPNASWPNERQWPPGAQHIPNAYKPDRFPREQTQWNDTDGDGWGDNYANISWGQNRIVGIFIPNAYKPDRYPFDPTRWNDTDGNGQTPPDMDGDGIPDHLDPDIDGDGWNNTIEMEVGTDVWDNTSYPSDLDGDWMPDVLDPDIDGDGWNNTIEREAGTDPYDITAFPSDLDSDCIPDIKDPDIDNDGWNNTLEERVGTDVYDNQSFPSDLDNDGILDFFDPDIDGDGWNNTLEERVGTDVYDDQSFPSDLDNDGTLDFFDPDIDGDGWNNTVELQLQTDPYDNSSHPSDLDSDGIPDALDPDRWEAEGSGEGKEVWRWVAWGGVSLMIVAAAVVVLWAYGKREEEVTEETDEMGRVGKEEIEAEEGLK